MSVWHAYAFVPALCAVLLAPSSWQAATRLNASWATAAVSRDALQGTSTSDPLVDAQRLEAAGREANDLGDFQAAREAFQRALSIRRKEAPRSPDTVKTLNNLGAVASQLGELSVARDWYRQALLLQQELNANSIDIATIQNNLGHVALLQGDFPAARYYHERALRVAKPLGPLVAADVASTYNHLGGLAVAEQRPADAEDHFRRASSIAFELQDFDLYADAKNNLGEVAYNRLDGDRAQHLIDARNYFEQALAYVQVQESDSLRLATVLHNLALVIQDQGDRITARTHFEEALRIFESVAPLSPYRPRTLLNLSILAREEGKLHEATRLAADAWERVKDQSADVAGDEARQAFGRSTTPYVATLVELQLALGDTDTAFLTLEDGRAQALRQMLLDQASTPGLRISTSASATYRKAVLAQNRAEAGLAAVTAAYNRAHATRAKAQLSREDHSIREAQIDFDRAREALDRATATRTSARLDVQNAWETLQRTAPALAPRGMPLSRARELLPADTVYVAFSVGRKHTTLFALRGGGNGRPIVASIPMDANRLVELVRAFRDDVSDPDRPISDVSAAGRTFFAMLFPADIQQLIAAAPRLILSPDGPLWDFPFVALVTNGTTGPTSPAFLGEMKAVTYAPSLAVLDHMESHTRPRPRVDRPATLLVGNPVFSRQPSGSARAETGAGDMPRGQTSSPAPAWEAPEPLPNTQTEVTRIARLYGTRALIGEAATEASVRGMIEKADVVHLATHGYFHPTRAMSSAVLLTVPMKPPVTGETENDGALQAWEILDQLTLKARLVVLSSCETGRGRVMRGEGVVGLARALQAAGAQSVVGSYWSVDDASTATFMVEFHRGVRRGLTKDHALQQAIVKLKGDASTSHPFYWAPFVLIGSRKRMS